jgi:hypothetical protein
MPPDELTTTGYHGTSLESAEKITATGFQMSRGEAHWLGEGVYFFVTGISSGLDDAREWAVVEAWDNTNYCNKYTRWGVVKATLKIKKLWDLTTEDGLKAFDYARKEMRKRVRPKGGEAQSGKKFDNSVIEDSAKRLSFDALQAWFYIKLDRDSRRFKVESGVQNTTVICVRDPNSLDQTSIVAEGLVRR